MKAYRIELLIIDFDELGDKEIKEVLENTKYPNWCISPNVMKITEKDIGEWDDDHPLNNTETMDKAYVELFKEEPTP